MGNFRWMIIFVTFGVGSNPLKIKRNKKNALRSCLCRIDQLGTIALASYFQPRSTPRLPDVKEAAKVKPLKSRGLVYTPKFTEDFSMTNENFPLYDMVCNTLKVLIKQMIILTLYDDLRTHTHTSFTCE